MFSTYVLKLLAKSVKLRGRILGFRDEDDDMGNAGWDCRFAPQAVMTLISFSLLCFYFCLFRGLPKLWDI
jgi:hypothetical protein